MATGRELIHSEGQLKFLGHIMWNDGSENLNLKGDVIRERDIEKLAIYLSDVMA